MKNTVSYLLINILIISTLNSCNKISSYSECTIKGEIDEGEYKGNGEMSYILNKLENNNFITEKNVVNINEDGSFELALNTGTFSILSLIYHVNAEEDSWQRTIPVYLNSSQTVKLSMQAQKHIISIKNKNDNNPDVLAYWEYQDKIIALQKQFYDDMPKPEEAQEFCLSYMTVADEIIAKYPKINKDLKEFLVTNSKALGVSTLYLLPSIYSHFKHTKFLPPEGYYNYRYSIQEIYNTHFAPFFSNYMTTLFAVLKKETKFVTSHHLEETKKQLEYLKKNFTNPIIVNKMTEAILLSFIQSYKIGPDFEQEIQEFSKLTKYLSHENQRTELINQFKNLKFTAIGSDIPNIEVEDANGKLIKLKDQINGQYLYIDLWASWCSPCKKEIPALKKLEKEYQKENIKFISISCDKHKNSWINCLKKMELDGNQFLDQKGALIKCLNVSGIPRFVIYSPDGELINPNAPLPNSGEKIRNELNKLLFADK